MTVIPTLRYPLADILEAIRISPKINFRIDRHWELNTDKMNREIVLHAKMCVMHKLAKWRREGK